MLNLGPQKKLSGFVPEAEVAYPTGDSRHIDKAPQSPPGPKMLMTSVLPAGLAKFGSWNKKLMLHRSGSGNPASMRSF